MQSERPWGKPETHNITNWGLTQWEIKQEKVVCLYRPVPLWWNMAQPTALVLTVWLIFLHQIMKADNALGFISNQP